MFICHKFFMLCGCSFSVRFDFVGLCLQRSQTTRQMSRKPGLKLGNKPRKNRKDFSLRTTGCAQSLSLLFFFYCNLWSLPVTLHSHTNIFCFNIRCGNVNWARRKTCNTCNAPKFTEVEERTGGSFDHFTFIFLHFSFLSMFQRSWRWI